MGKYDLIDIHTHILPGIDDRPKEIKQSFKILDELSNAGFSKVICTSHYYLPEYNSTNSQREKLILKLEQKAKEKRVELYNGCEYFYNLNLDKTIVPTLANSRYMLVEFALNIKPSNYMDFIYMLLENDIIPIIAHPERYRFVDDPVFYKELKEASCLFQVNYGSFNGGYGKKAQFLANYLMDNNDVDFLATDNHFEDQIYPKVNDIILNLEKKYGSECILQLTSINPGKIISNEKIQTNISFPNFNILQALKLKMM